MISNDPQMRHRAIQLIQPQPELSGEFTCKVSWSGVDTATKRMAFTLRQVHEHIQLKPTSHHMNLTCQAGRACTQSRKSSSYCSTHMPKGSSSRPAGDQDAGGRAYSVKVLSSWTSVPVHCLIHCELTLPHTGYSVAEQIPHIRGAASRSINTNLRQTTQKFTGRSLRRSSGYSSSGSHLSSNRISSRVGWLSFYAY